MAVVVRDGIKKSLVAIISVLGLAEGASGCCPCFNGYKTIWLTARVGHDDCDLQGEKPYVFARGAVTVDGELQGSFTELVELEEVVGGHWEVEDFPVYYPNGQECTLAIEADVSLTGADGVEIPESGCPAFTVVQAGDDEPADAPWNGALVMFFFDDEYQCAY